ncbi:hypothetical protein CJ030_MR2G028782 [Morella rubra]|uniref:Uncharacterized protein n=1 Tax=Morella rubra TaxID=262757 RepID=A0A6A1WA10_9ROSI|nr:hypothetical protein CJ030_MR2G028782 [Morella rubra]
MALSSLALKATFVTLGIIALVFAIVLPALVQAEDPVPYSGAQETVISIAGCKSRQRTVHVMGFGMVSATAM